MTAFIATITETATSVLLGKQAAEKNKSLTNILAWQCFFAYRDAELNEKVALDSLFKKDGQFHTLRGVASKAKSVYLHLRKGESITYGKNNITVDMDSFEENNIEAMPDIALNALYSAASAPAKMEKKLLDYAADKHGLTAQQLKDYLGEEGLETVLNQAKIDLDKKEQAENTPTYAQIVDTLPTFSENELTAIMAECERLIDAQRQARKAA